LLSAANELFELKQLSFLTNHKFTWLLIIKSFCTIPNRVFSFQSFEFTNKFKLRKHIT